MIQRHNATRSPERRIVPLPSGLFHQVRDLLEAADTYEIPQEEATERFNDMIGPYLPTDYDPETEEIVLQELRPPQTQVPRNYGAN